MDIDFMMLLIIMAVFGFTLLLNILTGSSSKNQPPTEIQEEIQEEKPRELNISEPVISFIKVYEDNPKRFKITASEPVESVVWRDGEDVTYKLSDKMNGNTFTIIYANGPYSERYSTDKTTNFLTCDELYFIFNSIRKCYENRKIVVSNYKKDKQRRRYIKDYCKENV